ncbi:MAG: TIGR03621 family F420-dependent LLM class oxidoreductase [Actinobacteria bacterium]|nr:TIGR03621 family F420-dependent LLM class oxidoreductase [Actinomycetota bacterium]
MSSARKFRFGVMMPRAESGAQVRDWARRAEDLGYSTLYVPDHFVDHPLGPIPTIAAVAAWTTTLNVGTLVLGNDYRHPVVLAKDAATIDLLSEGRLELGIGAGWMTVDYEKAGMALDRPGVRIERLQESVQILKGLWGEGPFSLAGEHYTVTDLDGDPKPFTPGGPKLVIGGGGQKVLTLAAQTADIVGINANLRSGSANDPSTAPSMNPANTDDKLRWVREAAGDRYADLEIQAFAGFAMITDDARPIAEGMAGVFEATPDEVLDSPVGLVGTVDEICESLERRRERWDMSYHVIPIEQMDACAPVVARLAGS